jgi:hypothetical protein
MFAFWNAGAGQGKGRQINSGTSGGPPLKSREMPTKPPLQTPTLPHEFLLYVSAVRIMSALFGVLIVVCLLFLFVFVTFFAKLPGIRSDLALSLDIRRNC